MRDLPLNALRAFAAVYARRGVRAAARELGIAHSSISRHLAQLESALGCALLERRSGRGPLRFTVHGETLGQTTLRSLGEIDQAVATIREQRSSGSVQIGAAPSLAVRWLLPRLGAFEEAHPSIEVSVIVDQRPEDPDAQGLDLVIRMEPGPWRDLRWRPLMGDALYPVMSRDFWESAGRPSNPEELAGLRLLHDRDPHAAWDTWKREFGPSSLDVRSGPRFTSTDLVLRAARQGQGVALARHRLAVDDLASGLLLRPIPELEIELRHAYTLVLPKQSALRPAARAVVEWLEREAERDGL